MSGDIDLKTLDLSRAVLFVVDVQERFRTAISGFDEMLNASIRLVKTFRLLERPIVVSEQYPKGLGRTVPELRSILGDLTFEEKTKFSCCDTPSALQLLADLDQVQAVVCGIETHVCVAQSVRDLRSRDFDVFLPVDAVASRKEQDRRCALERMSKEGAILSTTESLAFELLFDASHPKFKAVQALFK